jgi:hypothetical protein
VICVLAVLVIPLVIFIICSKWCFFCGFILCVIVHKLCCWQQLYSVVLISIDIVS